MQFYYNMGPFFIRLYSQVIGDMFGMSNDFKVWYNDFTTVGLFENTCHDRPLWNESRQYLFLGTLAYVLYDFFVTHGFFPKITVPTRCCKSSSSLIDQMFCKLKDPKQHLSSCVVKSCISDHFPYLSIFDILKKLGIYRNSYKSTVPMQTLFRHFIMKLNHNLILLKWTAICFVIQMKIISISKKLFWMQKPSILLPKQWNSKNTNTSYHSGWLTVFWIQSNIEIKYFLN